MTNDAKTVALITGASRGLGFEIARHYARHGIGLIVTARSAAPLATASSELEALTEVVVLPGDVSNAAHREELVRLGLARFGRIDILINNASDLGPSPLTELERYPIEALGQVLAVNVLAPLHLIQLALPVMRRQGGGMIVNVSSDAAVEAYPTWGGYGTSKAALEHLSRVLAEEVKESGIRVYTVDPGDMDTQMHRDAEPGEDLSHLPSPAVSAPAFLWLWESEKAPSGRYQAQEMPNQISAETQHAHA